MSAVEMVVQSRLSEAESGSAVLTTLSSARYSPPGKEGTAHNMQRPQDRQAPPPHSHPPPPRAYIPYNFYHDSISGPATPLSSAKTDGLSFRSASGSSATSPTPKDLYDAASSDGPDTTSSHTSIMSTLSTKNLPSPYLPLRKKSNRLKLHLNPQNERTLSSRSNSPSPSPTRSSRPGRLNTAASPLLSSERAWNPPSSPLATTAPHTPPKDDKTQNFRESEPYIPTLQTRNRARGLTTSSTAPVSSSGPQLKSSSSIPDLASFRSTQRSMISSTYKPDRGPGNGEPPISSRKDLPAVPWKDGDEARASFRSFRSAWTTASGLTTASSMYASETERSSVLTRASSLEMASKFQDTTVEDESMSVEDAISMYADFDDDGELEKRLEAGIEEVKAYMEGREVQSPRLKPDGSSEAVSKPTQNTDNADLFLFRQPSPDKAQSSSTPVSTLSDEERETPSEASPSITPPPPEIPLKDEVPAYVPPVLSKESPLRYHPLPPRVEQSAPVPRDRYGFKKVTQYITVEQYDEWNVGYTEYLHRRRRKWDTVMKQYGLTTENPIRFPPKSDKIKRFVRKGIPPEWRGAAWFWYAGGPDMLAREPGLYRQLLKRVQDGDLSETDGDIIERDLNRTFPDNVKFKPDPIPEHESFPGKAIRPPRSSSRGEARIVGALRRVLQAFAVHNFNIGYCQSLNFLAGLLLIFLDEDEEKAFILLNIITNTHLPGTHAKILEANVDIGVLMSCIRESMPAVWAKIDDSHEQPVRGRRGHPVSATRLPTVSLATTSWFMSCFVGTLPTESVLRVWDSLFYEGSKTLFRISLAIFKSGEQDIKNTGEQLEIFQVVQSIPRRLIDINALMESCFKRRNGFGHLSQETIDLRRRDRRGRVRKERAERERGRTIDSPPGGEGSAPSTVNGRSNVEASGLLLTPERPPTAGSSMNDQGKQGALRRAASKARLIRDQSKSRRRERATNGTEAPWNDAN